VRSTDDDGWYALPPILEEDAEPDTTEFVVGVCTRCDLEVLEFTGCGCWDGPTYA
jgi:hypothetical protein